MSNRTHAGAWSLAFSNPLTQVSTPAACRHGASCAFSSK